MGQDKSAGRSLGGMGKVRAGRAGSWKRHSEFEFQKRPIDLNRASRGGLQINGGPSRSWPHCYPVSCQSKHTEKCEDQTFIVKLFFSFDFYIYLYTHKHTRCFDKFVTFGEEGKISKKKLT